MSGRQRFISLRTVDELLDDALAVLGQTLVVEREDSNRCQHSGMVGHGCNFPIEVETKAAFAHRMKRRHKLRTVVFPPVVLLLCAVAICPLHSFLWKAGNHVVIIEVRLSLIRPTATFWLDVLNVRRISPDPPHRVSAHRTLLDDQSCQQGLLLGRWEFAVVGFIRAGNNSTPLRVAARGSHLLDVLHVANISRRAMRASSTDHSGRSSPFFFASAMAVRALVNVPRLISVSIDRIAFAASAGRSSASIRCRRIQLESIPNVRSGRTTPAAVNRNTCSGSTAATIWGECVVAMNWQRGNTLVSRSTIVRCHFGCKCRSSSSINTIASPSFTGSDNPGFACESLFARSNTSASSPRSPSDSCRASRSRPSFVTSSLGFGEVSAQRFLHSGRNPLAARCSAARCFFAWGRSPVSSSCARIQYANSASRNSRLARASAKAAACPPAALPEDGVASDTRDRRIEKKIPRGCLSAPFRFSPRTERVGVQVSWSGVLRVCCRTSPAL